MIETTAPPALAATTPAAIPAAGAQTETSPSTTAAAAPSVGPQTRISDLELREELADPNGNDLDKDAFLKLLVAQLRYQDPLDPSDPAEFMATTAQFTTIEKLNELTEQGASNAIVTGLAMASSLVGRSIDYVDVDDGVNTAVVTSATVVGGEVHLMTGAGAVSMEKVTAIGATATPGTAAVPPADRTATPSPPGTTEALAASPVADQPEGQLS
ncbi:MAG: hypothetical protein OEV40_11980 [Acidimicrobiia bacterium]|nr:hypothetical protein [Acidimicrobiia bacterium]